jgi:hypothetical protein
MTRKLGCGWGAEKIVGCERGSEGSSAGLQGAPPTSDREEVVPGRRGQSRRARVRGAAPFRTRGVQFGGAHPGQASRHPAERSQRQSHERPVTSVPRTAVGLTERGPDDPTRGRAALAVGGPPRQSEVETPPRVGGGCRYGTPRWRDRTRSGRHVAPVRRPVAGVMHAPPVLLGAWRDPDPFRGSDMLLAVRVAVRRWPVLNPSSPHVREGRRQLCA